MKQGKINVIDFKKMTTTTIEMPAILTAVSELTFEQLLSKATEVADARKKVAKDFLKFAKEVAIPKILEATSTLGFTYLEIWHDTQVFNGATMAGDGDVTHRYATRFYTDGLIRSATSLSYYDGVTYRDWETVSIGDSRFYGMVKALPLLTKELQSKVELREKQNIEALTLMKQ